MKIGVEYERRPVRTDAPTKCERYNPMNPKERLLACLRGEAVDRIPIYTLIPFVVTEKGFVPGAIHGYADEDDWRRRDPAYVRLVQRLQEECDNFTFWRPPCMDSDQLFLSPAATVALPEYERDGRRYMPFRAQIDGGVLTMERAVQPGTGYSWQIEHWCKTAEDARLLLDAPWKGLSPELDVLPEMERLLGDRGLIWVTIPSPILPVCRLFDPSDFLIFARTEKALIRDLMDLAAARIRVNLLALLDQGAGPIIRFGGAEHATPPLMSPKDFDELVVAYDEPLVRLCKERGRMVAYHCHGHLRHALTRFVEMGVDQIDPVETIPDGDVTIAEAKELACNQITLTGNIQSREINMGEPEEIAARVRELIEIAGPRRLVISTTGTPLEPMSSRVEANYHRLIDATLEWGKP
jgi:hypothetical protein